MTFNIAHGRGEAFNQLFLSRQTIEDNVGAIGRLLAETGADVVALQEADNASRWSGGFDHAQRLATLGGYPWAAHALHATNWLYNFGTAVLSRLPIRKAVARDFSPSPLTPRKGFVIGEVAWPLAGDPLRTLPLDIVSVHLDFLSSEARTGQIEEMVGILSGRSRPMIVLGDFNSEWSEDSSPVRELAERLDLKAYRTDAQNLATHRDARIDWILLSPQLAFKHYAVLPYGISDHQAVIAEVELDASYPGTIGAFRPVTARRLAGDNDPAAATPTG